MSIKLFEQDTLPLTDYELNTLIPAIIRGFKQHKGIEKAITSKKICEALTKNGYKASDVKLRKCIKHIQRNHLLNWIVATGEGFFYTEDPQIVKSQIESLRGREEAIRSVRIALENSVQKSLLTNTNR